MKRQYGFFLALSILFFFSGAFLSAQNSGEVGERLALKIAVIGPGDELYFWWGHIALIIEDRRAGREWFYDYGLFSFDNENFFVNFALGRLLYSCGASPAGQNYNLYTLTNRDITVYTLDLSPEKRDEVRRFAEWNVLPENRDYYYHHFKDNCATRIRDILDLATDGQFKDRFGEAAGRYTLRQHVRRHTWFSPFFDWLLSFLMGRGIDTPITVWEEMFLPSEIGLRMEDFSYTDEAGMERRLVKDVEVLNRAVNRPEVLEKPHRQWPWELLVGLSVTLVLAALLVMKERNSPAGRALWGLGQSLAGFFFGGAGSLLFFMTFFTNHDYTYHNINIIFINPLLILALPLGIGWIFAKTPERERKLDLALRILWTYAALFCLLSLLLRALPGFYQQNQVTAALFLPIALSMSFVSLGLGEFFRRVFWRWFD